MGARTSPRTQLSSDSFFRPAARPFKTYKSVVYGLNCLLQAQTDWWLRCSNEVPSPFSGHLSILHFSALFWLGIGKSCLPLTASLTWYCFSWCYLKLAVWPQRSRLYPNNILPALDDSTGPTFLSLALWGFFSICSSEIKPICAPKEWSRFLIQRVIT